MNILKTFKLTSTSKTNGKFDYKHLAFIIGLLFLSNLLTFKLFQNNFVQTGRISGYHEQPPSQQVNHKESHSLYLIDQARTYVHNTDAFERKVREVSRMLNIPPEWLMAVMHSESRFDASVKNHLGSGATGLIQFMPTTAKEHDITTDKLRNMNHIEQLDYVFQYLNKYRSKYGEYHSLTSLYLGILYPKAIGEEYCYTLYASPSKAYKMNAGLDEDKDNRVTVMDIDKRMKRKYKTAYMIDKDGQEKRSQYGEAKQSWSGFFNKN